MKTIFKKSPGLTMISFICAAMFSLTSGAANETAPKADNTKTNQAIEAKGQLTAQDQGTSEADIGRTAQIRKEITSQESFSTDAKNIKIITLNGKVVLKGPVKTVVEKRKIEKIAAHVAGKKNVTCELTVVK